MAKIFCDMDGVLVDLIGSIQKHLKTTKLNQKILDDFFDSETGTGTEFWAKCSWESGGKQCTPTQPAGTTSAINGCRRQCHVARPPARLVPLGRLR